MKIAVIEDDLPIAGLYEHKLKGAKFEVKVAHNGMDGLALLESFQPDLMLLDLRMPGMQGDELLQKVREADWGASIRVIILTNISRDEAPSVLRFLNVDRYIVKAHSTPSQILDIVNDVLGIKPNKIR